MSSNRTGDTNILAVVEMLSPASAPMPQATTVREGLKDRGCCYLQMGLTVKAWLVSQ